MMPVSPQLIAEMASLLESGQELYLHKETLELIAMPSDEDVEWLGQDDWQDLRKRVEEERKAFLLVPKPSSHDSYRMMQYFTGTVTNDGVRRQLENSLGGSGAFSRFRRMVEAHDLEASWYEFRKDYLQQWVRRKLEVEDLLGEE